ncbi:uncharacterized protein LOC110913703 isoform X2 [Helianthus annuus]|uniref:uncharacterized protein LOC110913703 isoform X2 n=1 Tax=Helianthus annuus TaxID=4232 RepID=UPI000B8F6ED5|nr:uncharacterized protein LOC110913703 isoform X2 [Helianthus annuus]XP_022014233.1 uncharacterized protein LOC110913703 isoform X2 [Helianthus annuus]
MVISIAPMLKMMVFSWGKTTSDHNQNGLEDSRKRCNVQGYTLRSSRQRPFLVQPLSPPALFYSLCPLSECISVGFLCMVRGKPTNHMNTGRNHASIRTKPTLELRFQWGCLY